VTQLQSLPLYTVLLALGKTNVDYLSLDVQGSEMEVLGTIPFDKVTIQVRTTDPALKL
jgi:hypothetical protein